MDNDDIILFTEYIKGTLDDLEKKSFERRLKEDALLSNNYEEFKEIYNVLENHSSDERARVIESIKEANSRFKSESSQKNHSKKTIPFKPWQMGIAASIFLAIGLFVFNSFGKPSYSEYASPVEIGLTVRNEADSISKKAETTFNSQNYTEAISYFDLLLETSPNNSEIKFYKGIALIETDNFEEADVLLKSLSEGESAYAYKAIYWRALSKLKQKKYKEVKTILQTISSSVPEYEKAQELLSDL